MPVDASIYSQIQQPQPLNPLNALAQSLQIKGLQSQLDRGDRETAQQNKLAELYRSSVGQDGTINRQQLLTGAASSGLGPQIPALQKGFSEQDKASREAQKAELEGVIQKFDVGARIMSVYDPANPQTWNMVRQQTAQYLGADAAARLPEQPPTPEQIQQNMNRAMSAKELAEQKYKMLTFGETQRHNTATEGLTAQGQAVSMRGQNLSRDTAMRGQDMTDARAREANANGRVPTGYRQTADGTLEFIPGGPADPSAAKKAAPTEFQGKSAIFGSRAQEADRILSELGTDYSPAGINAKNAVGATPLIGGALEAGANAVLSKESQKAEQAQRDFVNAVLRLESGAAIGKDEFQNAKRQYFPQPGDSAEVIAQKAANRKLQIQGLLGNAGNAPIPKAEAAPEKPVKTKVIGGKTYANDGKGWYAVN